MCYFLCRVVWNFFLNINLLPSCSRKSRSTSGSYFPSSCMRRGLTCLSRFVSAGFRGILLSAHLNKIRLLQCSAETRNKWEVVAILSTTGSFHSSDVGRPLTLSLPCRIGFSVSRRSSVATGKSSGITYLLSRLLFSCRRRSRLGSCRIKFC